MMNLKFLFLHTGGNNKIGIPNAIAGIPASVRSKYIFTGGRTCGWRARNAVSISASLLLMESNGFEGASQTMRCVYIGIPASSSRSMSRSERPSSCVSNLASESKRTMSSRKLLQSSCSSHLQYISTRGRSSMQVARRAWREGLLVRPLRRHTRCPARPGSVIHTNCPPRSPNFKSQ